MGDYKGLKSLRQGVKNNWTRTKPEIKCGNCGCMRYNTCTCSKPGKEVKV